MAGTYVPGLKSGLVYNVTNCKVRSYIMCYVAKSFFVRYVSTLCS